MVQFPGVCHGVCVLLTGTGEYSHSSGSRQLQISYCVHPVLQDNEMKS